VSELVLGLSSAFLEKAGVGRSFLPSNDQQECGPDYWGHRYHPLLQTVPAPNTIVKKRCERDTKDASLGKVLNLSYLRGREFIFRHNSKGLRGAELTSRDLAKPLIFVYGGSSTYDFPQTQGETWPEKLQEALDNRYTVINFGVPMYTTTEALIQTAFYQNIFGKMPVCALYYEGLNDLFNSHIKDLDPGYADWDLLSKPSRINVRKPRIWMSSYSPILSVLSDLARSRFDSLPEAPTGLRKKISGVDEHMERIFADHVATITAINSSRGVKTIFVGQMLAREFLAKYPGADSDEITWAVQEHLNLVLRETAISKGAGYIDPGVEQFKSSTDFTDYVHFAGPGSAKFAKLIADDVNMQCK